METEKQCRNCKQVKPLSQFYRRSANKDGHQTWCKQCSDVYGKAHAAAYYAAHKEQVRAKTAAWRAANPGRKQEAYRLREYGLAPTEYKRLLAVQGGKCAICGIAGTLVVDHCHQTGVVRGLLCHGCNKALGYFRDSPHALEAAAAYVRRFGAESEAA